MCNAFTYDMSDVYMSHVRVRHVVCEHVHDMSCPAVQES